jgi:hypothetical protein
MIWQTTFGTVEVVEEVLRLGRRGPLLRGLGLSGYSKKLQRVLTDFGAEDSFEKAGARVMEHYGIEVSGGAVRRITLAHGRRIGQIGEGKRGAPAKQIVTQMDGSMIPIVQAGKGADHRKGKTLLWREVRLCCTRADGQADRLYGATLGSVENASWMWRQTAQRAGLTERTHVHGVGDGAPWIVDRFKENFGRQGNYLLDFFHVSEYLAAAGLAIVGQKKSKAWLRRQQGRLLNNRWRQVLRSMEQHQERPGQEEAPVRSAYRYLLERTQYLDFEGARKCKLPIGSGEIESSHRHVVQRRLKLAGSWWKESNAQTMLSLRTARANHDWLEYWTSN